MKIHDLAHGRIGTQAVPDGRPGARTPASAPPQGRSADRVQLSDLAGQMRDAAIVEDARHAERLAELRALIEAGVYEVSAEDLADAILREEILPWIVK